MKLVPKFDRLTIRPINDEAPQTKSGLAIPQVALGKRAYYFGEVLAVGPGRSNAEGVTIPVTTKVGDIVAIPRNAGVPFPIIDDDGKEEIILIVREPELFATVEDLPRVSSIVGMDGSLLHMRPSSLALPDEAYKNLDATARARHELKDAPPDVLADLDDDDVVS